MNKALLTVSGLCAGYGDATVLQDVSLTLDEGSVTAVIGSNGAGKTTLMRVLAGILPARTGTIRWATTEITADGAVSRVERGLAMVPEGRLVFPDLTVQETLRIGAYVPRTRATWRARADELYALFPRLAERRQQRAGSLSGGEQQMLALARGLMSRPKLLLLDEPSLGLAPQMARQVFEAVQRIRESGVTVCLVEQDVHAALRIADTAYVIEHGQVTIHGAAASLLGRPDIRAAFLGL
jgi:branched-chain amino acid transport system ATP-binding protein